MTYSINLKSKGQTLLEFALVIGIALLLILMIFDLGMLTFSYNLIANAAREAARFGVVHSCHISEIQDVAIDYSTPGLDSSNLTIIVFSLLDPDRINVSITYDYEPFTPFLPVFIGASSINLAVSSSMLIDQCKDHL